MRYIRNWLFLVVAVCAGCVTNGEIKNNTREQVTAESISQLYGKQLFLNNDFIIIRNSGTFDGTWKNRPIAGTYEMRDGYFCRILSQFFQPERLNVEDCQLLERDATTVKGTRARGKGSSWVYKIVE